MRPSRRKVRWIAGALASASLALVVSLRAGVITGNKWYPMGPKPSCCFFNGGEGGRATSLAVNQFNPDDLWLGTAGGGVWHSQNAGLQWVPTSDDRESLAIGAVAVAGCNVNGCAEVYAGTGENAIRRDTYYGQGLLIGHIGGGGVIDWHLSDGGPSYSFKFGSINDVVLDRNTSGVNQELYITLSSGVTASASESTVTAPEPYPGGYGLYKSANDGVTWTRLNVAGAAGYRPTDLEMDRTNSSVLYAGFLGRGIFKSTDGGANWCPLNPGITRPQGCAKPTGLPDPTKVTFDHVEIEISRANQQLLYASFGSCANRLLDDCRPGVYMSINAGQDWTLQSPAFAGAVFGAPCPSGYSRYTHALTAHPTTPGKIFLGGIHLCASSNNGAGSWACADTSNLGWRPCSTSQQEAGDVVHFDHRAVVFAESDPSRAYDINDGGIAVSTNGGQSWTPRNFDLQTFGFQSIATSPHTARVIGGAQDNGGTIWLGWKLWYNLPCCGDGGFSIMDRDDKMKMYITSNTGGTAHTVVVPRRSLDGGLNFPASENPPLYNIGLDSNDPRSFYPPLVEDPTLPHPLYFATHRLWKSTDDATHWAPVSPVLSTDDEPEIFMLKDVITAVAVAPTNPSRIYIGYYSGKVFVSDPSPCTTPNCWPARSSGLPAAPITWIAVDPTDASTAYVTQSGFGPGVHVFKTTNAGVSWNPTSLITFLNGGVPANTIAIEPSAPNRLWLGTDKGVLKSTNYGTTWSKAADGLPNVPVYSLAIDADRNRVIAATHGRGAFVLSQPSVTTLQGCVNDQVTDVPVYGLGFMPNNFCKMQMIRKDGTVCAPSSAKDALGGLIVTDDQGFLGSNKPAYFNNLPIVWGCAQNNCLGAPIADCNQAGNPISTVVVTCASQTAYATIQGCPPTSTPPSSWVTLFQLAGGISGMAGDRPDSPSACYDPAIAGGGSFQLLPSVQSGDGSSRILCSVNVSYSSLDTTETILQSAQDAVNADPSCQSAGVSATLLPEQSSAEVEDLFSHPGNLTLSDPGVTGAQLVTAVRAAPGQTMGTCFKMQNLGVPVADRIMSTRVRLATAATGAQGGDITLREVSPLGECSITVPTVPGATPETIATALAAAFQAPGIPGPVPDCPAERNPRDVVHEGGSIVTSAASALVLCVNDAGVGFGVAPRELCASDADCDDRNPCTTDTCNTATGQCHSDPVPDGLPCDDANSCTIGNTCMSGVCGRPVDCGDFNPCTTDTCDPATGRCLNTPVICDDANVCTTDLCNPDTGTCLFLPMAGAVCDDGDLCTSGDTCVQQPGTSIVACQGTAKCDDGDACTGDLCDPATGQCSNPPVQCDEGNPCTIDSCSGGACHSDPVFGQPCDDGNRCTVGDTCVGDPTGAPVCQGQLLVCDDRNACTIDSCDPVLGACVFTPAALAEVPGLQFQNSSILTWSESPGVLYWNTYRGTIPATLLGSRRPPLATYDQVCFERDDSHGDGAQVATDTANPPAGSAFYYNSTLVTPCGEGPIGTESDGTLIPNSSRCVVP